MGAAALSAGPEGGFVGQLIRQGEPPMPAGIVWTRTGQGYRSRDGRPNIDALAGVLAEAQTRFDLGSVWSFQWANDCTHPLPGAYGGGAAVVAGGKTTWLATSSWVVEREEEAFDDLERLQ